MTVDGISQPFGETPQELQPVPRPLEFSVLIHVDAEGRPRFLKDVVLIADEAGEVKMIANPTPGSRLIRTASARALRHAKRFSSATFSFDGPSLPAEGRFDVDGTVEATIRIGAEDRVNPFVHQFRPDHSASAKQDVVVERDVAMKLEALNAGHDIATGEFSERVKANRIARTQKKPSSGRGDLTVAQQAQLDKEIADLDALIRVEAAPTGSLFE